MAMGGKEIEVSLQEFPNMAIGGKVMEALFQEFPNIAIGGKEIKVATSVKLSKLLGLAISYNLTWNDQNQFYLKGSRPLVKIYFYFCVTCISSVPFYFCCTSVLERVQKRVVKVIHPDLEYNASPAFAKLHVNALSKRHRSLRTTDFNTITEDDITIYSI